MPVTARAPLRRSEVRSDVPTLPTASEHDEQVIVMQWCALAQAQRPALALLYAIPNGGHRHPATAARLKAEGVKRGVPDLCLPVARGRYHGLYLELKAGRNTMTREQAAWLAALEAEGYAARCVTGAQSAMATLTRYLDLRPAGSLSLTDET